MLQLFLLLTHALPTLAFLSHLVKQKMANLDVFVMRDLLETDLSVANVSVVLV